ncbi:hypothetical protein GGR58DRAFT_518122 [Xylaria digitata]|nr:hypothetical protein GGR58DRAFT_518122 [Xylaria digitata]
MYLNLYYMIRRSNGHLAIDWGSEVFSLLLDELTVAGALEVLCPGPRLVVALTRVGAFKLPLATLHANDKSSAYFFSCAGALKLPRRLACNSSYLAASPYSSLTRLTPFRVGVRVKGYGHCCAVQN